MSYWHYEPRSQKCLNLLSTRELSNKSQNCLYKVSNQFLIWSQTYLKFETILRHGRDNPIILSQLRITRLAAHRRPGD